MNIHPDSDDIFRLYIREWVIIHTLTGTGDDTTQLFDEADAWIKENLDGRVRVDDIRLNMYSDKAGTFWCHVEVFKDNQKGEFKQLGSAKIYAEIHRYEEYTIVARNSTADHKIRSYGVTKL